ncbi:MAG TPA: hypothetical protein VF519_08810 [Mycobacteriales bacterium]|jgi:hypothetical protein
MTRTLRLSKDVLTELANDELSAVVGGQDVTVLTICYGVSCPLCPTLP